MVKWVGLASHFFRSLVLAQKDGQKMIDGVFNNASIKKLAGVPKWSNGLDSRVILSAESSVLDD